MARAFTLILMLYLAVVVPIVIVFSYEAFWAKIRTNQRREDALRATLHSRVLKNGLRQSGSLKTFERLRVQKRIFDTHTHIHSLLHSFRASSKVYGFIYNYSTNNGYRIYDRGILVVKIAG